MPMRPWATSGSWFGIDSPFHHPTVEIQKVMACGVDDEGLENIFYNNAAKFMGLK